MSDSRGAANGKSELEREADIQQAIGKTFFMTLIRHLIFREVRRIVMACPVKLLNNDELYVFNSIAFPSPEKLFETFLM